MDIELQGDAAVDETLIEHISSIGWDNIITVNISLIRTSVKRSYDKRSDIWLMSQSGSSPHM
jgi:hypothetical protein